MLLVRVGHVDAVHGQTTPPLGILYLAAYVRERFDVELQLIDQLVDGRTTDEIVRTAAQFQPDVVGLSCLTAFGYMLGPITRTLREALPKTLIMLGGPHASAFKMKVLEDTVADVAVVGEGELSCERVLQSFLGNKDFSAIPGLLWRTPDGQVEANPGATPFVEDLDSLPMPAYDLLDLTEYWRRKSFVFVPHRKYVALLSSRGCPYQCSYCHQIFGKRFRSHSASRIVSEIEFFTKKCGVNEVEFIDDIFNHDYDRVLEFCDLMHQRNLRVKLAFPNGFRTDRLSEELIDALRETGLYYASFALESGSPRIQKEMGKCLDIPGFLKNVAYSVKRGVFSNGYAMLGFPDETDEEIRQTISVMCKSKLHMGEFFTVTPFPGTPLYEYVARTRPEKLTGINYDKGMYGQMYVNLSAVPDRVFFAHQRRANLRFYMNPSRAFRVIRDHPSPKSLVRYLPVFLERTTKGAFHFSRS